MHKDQRNFFRRLGLAMLSGALLALGVNILCVAFLNKMDIDLRAIGGFKTLNILTQSKLKTSNSFEDTLLIDSVVSIVQGYYVDQDRIENAQLLSRMIRNLGYESDIDVTPKSERSFLVRVGNKSLAVDFSDELDYADLVERLVIMSRFLDENLPVNQADSGAQARWSRRGNNIVLNSLLNSLDAHSALLSEESYRDLRQGTEGAFGGLGVVVGIRDDVLTVLRPLPRSPAERIGIARRDKIIAIDGLKTFGYDLDHLVEYMRGKPGTPVKVDLLRKGDLHPRTFELRREMITVDSVSTREINFQNKTYLHVQIDTFSSKTSDELKVAIAKFRSRHNGVPGLILDLRSNPGGLLDQAIEVSNLFIKTGVIVSTRGRRTEIESAQAENTDLDFPIVVLINEDSASASEIVAGALQDHQRALVIGQPSFGKGSVQTIFELPGEMALKLTIARYFTPLGKSIQNIGIQPDVWLQPIVERPRNMNLFGLYRYRNESSLLNHLEALLEDDYLPVPSPISRDLKAYYLIKKDRDDFESDSEETDQERQAALVTLSEVRKVYPDKFDAWNMRASHWLAIAAPRLKKSMRDFNKESLHWLKEKHQIEWSEFSFSVAASDVLLKINVKDAKLISTSRIKIPWMIRNQTTRPLHRLSIFISSIQGLTDSSEILLGEIEGGGVKSGFFSLKLENFIQRSVALKAGVAADGSALMGSIQDLKVELPKSNKIEVSPVVSLANEKGGSLPGVIEAGESGSIRVELMNLGGSTVRDISVGVNNLAGSQINCPVDRKSISELQGGKKLILDFPFLAGSEIFGSEALFGLTVSSEDLTGGTRQSILIQTLPGKKSGVSAATLGH